MSIPEILIRPDLGKKAYRLKCRFTVDAHISPERFEKLKFEVAEAWVEDMKLQGWEYDPNRIEKSQRGFNLSGPFYITPVTGLPKFHERRKMTSKEMLPMVAQGRRVFDEGRDWAVPVTPLNQSDKWDWEISAVFIHETILTEIPDAHEERQF